MTRSAKAGIGAVLALVLAFGVWWFGFRADPVFDSVVPAVEVAALRPPQYAAPIPTSGQQSPGLVVRTGSDVRRLFRAQQGVWLDDGRYLFSSYHLKAPCAFHGDAALRCRELVARVLDPRTGRVSAVPGLPELSWSDMPGEALHRVTVTTAVRTTDAPLEVSVMLGSDLGAPETLKPPGYHGHLHFVSRDFGRRVFSIGDWDFLEYSDNDEEDYGVCGYLQRRTGSKSWKPTLVNKNIDALWVSSDGRALLGVQQKAKSSCASGVRSQRIVEIDPRNGTIARTYGVPTGYDKSWRIGRVDKVGDRVLVRFFSNGNVLRNRGVWAYDGHWSPVRGTTGPFTWWQGRHDRIEARPPVVPPKNDAYFYDLYWVHGSKATRLPERLAPLDVPGWRGAPGSLVPPN